MVAVVTRKAEFGNLFIIGDCNQQPNVKKVRIVWGAVWISGDE